MKATAMEGGTVGEGTNKAARLDGPFLQRAAWRRVKTNFLK